MPKILRVRAPQDEKEERWVRKLAASRHGPADWIVHARIVVRSWDGERVETIAKELGCSALTLRRRLHRFDAEGIEGLGDRPKPEGSAQWSLDALAQAAKEAGIVVKRSQIRRILLKEKVRWRRTHSWGTPRDKDARPKRTAVVTHSTDPPKGSTTICTDELGPVVPRTFPPAPGWSPGGHRIKAELDYSRGPEKTWVYGALRVRDGKEVTRCAASRNSKGYIALLTDIEADNPSGDIFLISDNLSSHNSLETRTWLEGIRASITSSFPLEPAGSTCKRAGGAFSAAMRWQGRVLPILRRSSKPRVSPRRNSTDAPKRGSGADLPRIIAAIVVCFVTVFKE